MASVTLRYRKLPSGKKQAYLDIYRGQGSRKTEALGIVPEGTVDRKNFLSQVKEKRSKRETEINSEVMGVSMPFDSSEDFIAYAYGIAATKLEPTTRKLYETALSNLKECAGRDRITFAEIASKQFMEKFKKYLLNQVSDGSAQTYFFRLRALLNQAVSDNRLPFNPSSGISIKVDRKLPIFLTIEEVNRLNLAPCFNENVKNAFLFSCFSGLRLSDIRSLTWDNIIDGYVEFRQKKTGQQERLPLSAEAKAILERQKYAVKSRVKAVFPPGTVFFLPIDEVLNRNIRRWVAAAKVHKAITFHKARHTFATLCLSSGQDLYVTSKLLGHKSIATTQVYAQVIDSKKVEAVESLPRLTDSAP